MQLSHLQRGARAAAEACRWKDTISVSASHAPRVRRSARLRPRQEELVSDEQAADAAADAAQGWSWPGRATAPGGSRHPRLGGHATAGGTLDATRGRGGDRGSAPACPGGIRRPAAPFGGACGQATQAAGKQGRNSMRGRLPALTVCMSRSLTVTQGCSCVRADTHALPSCPGITPWRQLSACFHPFPLSLCANLQAALVPGGEDTLLEFQRALHNQVCFQWLPRMPDLRQVLARARSCLPCRARLSYPPA